MPEFYTREINQLKENGEKQLSDFGSRGGPISPLMHVPLSTVDLLICIMKHRSHSDIVDKPLTLYPGVPSSIPSCSPSDETKP